MTPKIDVSEKIQLAPLADLMLTFARVPRVTMHPDGQRMETDADHSLMLVVIACSIATAHPELNLNPGRVAQLAAIHDLPEFMTGDLNTFGLSENPDREVILAKKAETEEKAINYLLSRFCTVEWLTSALQVYQDQKTREARFVRLVDKILPKLTHTLNRGRAIEAMGKTWADMVSDHTHQFQKLKTEYPDFQVVLEYLMLAMVDAEVAMGSRLQAEASLEAETAAEADGKAADEETPVVTG